jgi:signal transduction histidine kinase
VAPSWLVVTVFAAFGANAVAARINSNSTVGTVNAVVAIFFLVVFVATLVLRLEKHRLSQAGDWA